MIENSKNTETKNPEISEEEAKQAAMSYFLLLAPVLYLNRKESEFIQFHAKQGSVLLVFFILFWLLGDVNIFLFGFFHWMNFATIAAAVLGFLKAIKGEKYPLPFVGEIAENNFSPESIWKSLKKAGKISGKIILGFFPKHTGDQIAQKLKVDPDAHLLARIENIEKILIQDKFLKPEISEKIGNLSQEQKQYFSEIITQLKKRDKNLKLHEEDTFLEISGNFGTVIVGGVKKQNPENSSQNSNFFSYAINSESLVIPENSLEFGAFRVGNIKIGDEKFLK